MKETSFPAFIAGILAGALIMLLFFTFQEKRIREYVVKEYLECPDHFKIYQIKDDTLTIGIQVEYLK